ncbi:MAG: MFS transporter [Dehalococcoidia bacterium]|nr:MFS transporter [Dehalococcoidia bacterium]
MTAVDRDGPPPAEPITAGAVLKPSRWNRTFTSLSEPEYAWYFVGNVAFFMAMQMQMVLRGFLAYDLTGKATSLAAVSLAIAIPMLVVAPFGGVVADRVNKRNLLLVTQVIAAAASLLVAVLIIMDVIVLWHLVAVSFLTGCVFSFNMPARQALVPNLVPQHKLMNAISLQMGGMNLTRILAPALGGLLIVPMGVGWVYMLTTVLFTLAVLSETHLPKHGMKSTGERKSFREDYVGGFRYILEDPTLRLLMTVALLMPLFAFPVQQLLPVFASDVFTVGGADADGLRLGILAAAMGVGGLAGAIVSANMDTVAHKGKIMLIGGTSMGAFMLLFGLAPTMVMATLFLIAMGVGQMIFQATNNTTIQAGLPGEMRGRVMSILMMSFGLMPLGVVPISFAADAWGAQAAISGAAVVMLVVLFGMYAISERLRSLRFEAAKESQLSPVQAAALVAQGKMTQEEADELTGEADRRRTAAAIRAARQTKSRT